MKTFLTTLLIFLVLAAVVTAVFYDDVMDFFFGQYAAAEKPVIYLYPEEECAVQVGLSLDGDLTVSYPAYPDDGWSVTAAPDSTLTDADGRTYDSLFWEAELNAEYDLSRGFCVAGADTAAFLEETLAALGLSEREANAFIVYWLPRMQDNAYNLITFQSDAYTDAAELTVEPTPDTVIRVFMVWQGLDSAIEIPESILPEVPVREGFTVVEWGGAEITE